MRSTPNRPHSRPINIDLPPRSAQLDIGSVVAGVVEAVVAGRRFVLVTLESVPVVDISVVEVMVDVEV